LSLFAVDVGNEDVVSAAAPGGVLVAVGCPADALGVADEAAAVVDVSACSADRLIAYEEAEGRADSRDCAVSFMAVALREMRGLSNLLQQMFVWSAVSVHVSLGLVSYMRNVEFWWVGKLAYLDFKQQKVLIPDEQACWLPEGVVRSPPSQSELGPQHTASAFPGMQQ
jgi:hypothetical protein